MINNHHSTGIFSFKGGAAGWPHSIIFLYAHLNVQLVDKNPEEDQKDASDLGNHMKYRVINLVFVRFHRAIYLSLLSTLLYLIYELSFEDQVCIPIH